MIGISDPLQAFNQSVPKPFYGSSLLKVCVIIRNKTHSKNWSSFIFNCSTLWLKYISSKVMILLQLPQLLLMLRSSEQWGFILKKKKKKKNLGSFVIFKAHSKKKISSIMFIRVYLEISEKDLSRLKIKTHEIQALSLSLAFKHNMELSHSLGRDMEVSLNL